MRRCITRAYLHQPYRAMVPHENRQRKMARNRLRRDCPREIVDCSTIYAATDVLLKIGGDRDLLVVVLVEIPVKNTRNRRGEKRVI